MSFSINGAILSLRFTNEYRNLYIKGVIIMLKMKDKLDDNTYRVSITYEAEDEIDIIIRVLSFGPNLKVVGPESFIKQIKSRLFQVHLQCILMK